MEARYGLQLEIRKLICFVLVAATPFPTLVGYLLRLPPWELSPLCLEHGSRREFP